ncbi:MAG: hypothetical protein QOF26_90 [Baekduia sp.]|jgi:hypothetical protein|nr:hypothetical protein [Baekduia sp.]
MYRALGCAHATIQYELKKAHRALVAGESGQGTVEYIGLILLIAGIMAAVVAAKADNGGKDIGKIVVDQLKKSIDGIGGGK